MARLPAVGRTLDEADRQKRGGGVGDQRKIPALHRREECRQQKNMVAQDRGEGSAQDDRTASRERDVTDRTSGKHERERDKPLIRGGAFGILSAMHQFGNTKGR